MIPIVQSVKVAQLRKIHGDSIDLEKWIQIPNNLYVGRRGRVFITEGNQKRVFHYPDSKWGNPYKGENCLQLYEDHVRKNLYDQIGELANKTIGCFCVMKPYEQGMEPTCHTHILVKLYLESR